MKRSDLSVIVCNHKPGFLKRCISSIQESVHVDYEIIIVTSDPDFNILEYPNCRVVKNLDMKLPAEKRNHGASIANGSYLAFFDDDVEIRQDCLYELKKALDNSDASMVYGKLWNMEFPEKFDEAGGFLTLTGFIWSRAQQNDVDIGQYNEDCYILAGKSANCMVRLEDFIEVGGFDEDFGILGEETDLSWRLWLKNKPVLFAYRAAGWHAFNTKLKDRKVHYTNSRVYFNGCRNYITMLMKNLGIKKLWKILPIHLTIWSGVICASIFTLDWKRAYHLLRGFWYVLSNLGLILKKRSEVQKGRVLTDDDIFAFCFRWPSGRYFTERFRRYLSQSVHG